jgi:hypothetical protein
VSLYSAAIDPQTLQSSLEILSKENPDFGADVLDGLTKKINNVTTHLGTYLQVVNDFDKTIERIHCIDLN